jgi:hypothetical protein
MPCGCRCGGGARTAHFCGCADPDFDASRGAARHCCRHRSLHGRGWGRRFLQRLLQVGSHGGGLASSSRVVLAQELLTCGTQAMWSGMAHRAGVGENLFCRLAGIKIGLSVCRIKGPGAHDSGAESCESHCATHAILRVRTSVQDSRWTVCRQYAGCGGVHKQNDRAVSRARSSVRRIFGYCTPA